MANSFSSSRRSSFSTLGVHQPRAKTTTTKQGQCTHITMARLYTTDFQCMICLRSGSFGWLYRCTQDRETLIENDIELGREEKFDSIYDVFPKSKEPKKRSANARQNRLSLLHEISEEQFHSYTLTQLGTLLKQRSDVLDILSESNVDSQHYDEFFPVTSVDEKQASAQTSRLLPSKECQFKCCPACRPTMRERSYLSLDGIVNGDFPAIATTGFGFHLQKQRPFGSIEHVRNLGLRPSPPSRPISTGDSPPQPRQRQMFFRGQNFGLGISNNEREPGSGRSVVPARFSLDSVPPLSDSGSTTDGSNPEMVVNSYESILTLNAEMHSAIAKNIPRPLPTPPRSTTAIFLWPIPAAELALASLLNQEQEAHPAQEPLTSMEQAEKDTVACGRLPLAVPSGLAVTDETLQNHVASVITQV